jgi:hypothetical protein
MSRPAVGVALTVLAVAVLLLLLTIEARLTTAGERKLAAAVNGLAVAVAVAGLLSLMLLISRLGGWLRRTTLTPRLARRPPQERGSAAAEPRLPRERADRQP